MAKMEKFNQPLNKPFAGLKNQIEEKKEKDSNEATVFIQYNKEIENKGKKGKHSVKTLTRGTITKENGLIISLPEELRHLNSKQILKEIIDSIELM